MKLLLSLFFLTLSLTSCDDEKIAAKSCTLNGSPVDCKELEPTQTQPSARTGTQLKATLEVGYTVFSDGGKNILLIDEDEKSVHDENGNECTTSTIGLGELNYSFKGENNNLVLSNSKIESAQFQRVNGVSNKLKGSFTSNEDGMYFTLSFNDRGVLTMTTVCYY